MFFRLRLLHPTRDRRLISAMLLAVALGSGLIISIPQRVRKDRSVPFPCMDCNCSCHDAQSCWEGCGCLSPASKLAWANEHGVQPPEWFLSWTAANNSRATGIATSCCSANKAARACCDTKRCDDESTVAVIPGIGKRRCHAIDRLYVMLSMVLPVEPPAPICILLPPDRLGPVRSVSFQGLEASGLIRPPERATV